MDRWRRGTRGGRGGLAMSVVIAGGGSAGHIEPALALADALRRAEPGIRITCLGTAARPGNQAGPAAGIRPGADPAGPAAAVADPGAAVCARPAGRCGQGGDTGAGPDPGAGAGRVRRVRVGARLPGGPAPPGADRGARGERRPGVANRLGAMFTRYVFTASPEHQAAARHRHRHPAPAGDRRPGPAGPDGQGARPLRAAARPAGAAGHRRIAGRPVAQPGGAGRGRLDPRRRDPGAAHARPAQRPAR